MLLVNKDLHKHNLTTSNRVFIVSYMRYRFITACN